MTNINWNTTELKLNRLKVKFDYHESSNILRIGGVNKLKLFFFYVGLPLLLAIILLIMTSLNYSVERSNYKGFAFAGAMFLVSFFGYFSVKRMLLSNKNNSILSPGKLIILGDSPMILKSEEIEKFDFEIDSTEKQGFHGLIKAYAKKSEEQIILGLMSDDSRLLRDDLAYLVKYFNQLVLSQKN